MSRCSVSGQPAGWVVPAGGSAHAGPLVETGKTREKPHFHGWRIGRLGTIFAWQSSHILSNIRSRQWAKSCDLFRNQSWNGPASFAKPARTMIASSRRPIQPANVRNRTNEQPAAWVERPVRRNSTEREDAVTRAHLRPIDARKPISGPNKIHSSE